MFLLLLFLVHQWSVSSCLFSHAILLNTVPLLRCFHPWCAGAAQRDQFEL